MPDVMALLDMIDHLRQSLAHEYERGFRDGQEYMRRQTLRLIDESTFSAIGDPTFSPTNVVEMKEKR